MSCYEGFVKAVYSHDSHAATAKTSETRTPDNPAWSLGSCSLTREVLSSIAEYRSPDLSPGKQRTRRLEIRRGARQSNGRESDGTAITEM